MHSYIFSSISTFIHSHTHPLLISSVFTFMHPHTHPLLNSIFTFIHSHTHSSNSHSSYLSFSCIWIFSFLSIHPRCLHLVIRFCHSRFTLTNIIEGCGRFFLREMPRSVKHFVLRRFRTDSAANATEISTEATRNL